MGEFLDALPIVAAAFAIPQFLPQIRKLRRTGDTAGVSWPWAMLTSVSNGAWVGYFALSASWAALVPASSATLLAGALAVMLARRGRSTAQPAVLIGAWAALLAIAFTVAGRGGLGTLLTAAFVLQVTPSVWTAYRTARPTGISAGTWLLILGELSCWTSFGVHKADPRLIVLGLTGVAASMLMLARIRWPDELPGVGRERACRSATFAGWPPTGAPTTTGASTRPSSTGTRSSPPHRRPDHPLPARPLAARRRQAAAAGPRLARLKHFQDDMMGYVHIQGTRPQTLAYGLTDSPAGQLAWMVEKFKEWSDPATELPEDAVGRDRLLTDVSLYWFTATAGSSATCTTSRGMTPAGWTPRSPGTVPTGVAVSRSQDVAIRRLAERDHNIVHWIEFERSGHFAALEAPAFLVSDMRTFLRGPPTT